ncbi:MAG TPA: CocE/NonD family hydrolase, partial [Bacteroidetes bacterium]|nr:CocE/NonD family hydrolase [Bacteroidota bacterium]
SKLIMGPWVHEGYLGEWSGDYYYPNQSPGIMLAVTDALLEAWLLDNFTRWEMLPTVAFYLMSSLQDPPFDIANNWYQADAWPIPFTPKTMYLFENGSLLEQQPSTDTGAISYLYDPNDPAPTKGGGNLNIDAGPYDQSEIEQRDDVITFTSPVLQEPFTFVGQANITLYVSSNCTDTDFAVKITDVYPDNTSMLITDTIIRARNRNSYSEWDFLTPGQIYELTIPLDSTAYLFKAGHRIRIDISSANYPRFEANPNTGDPLWENSTTYIANNTIFVNSVHASHIVFPEVDYSSLTPYSFDPVINAQPQNSQKQPNFTVQETPMETLFSQGTLAFAMAVNVKKIGNRF